MTLRIRRGRCSSASTDQFTGFDYDLGSGHRRQAGRQVRVREDPFDSIIIGIQAGNLDVAMSSMYDNMARQKKVDFVDYAKDGTGILVAEGQSGQDHGFRRSRRQELSAAKRAPRRPTRWFTLNEQFKTEGKPQMTISQFPDQPAALLGRPER